MPQNIVQSFIHAVNGHDIESIVDCLTADHVFIDAQGNRTEGREAMKTAWAEYFRLFPDYRIEIEEMFSNGPSVTVTGFASGTYQQGETWHIPAAWKAHTVNGSVDLWQVYADTKIPFDSIQAAAHHPQE